MSIMETDLIELETSSEIVFFDSRIPTMQKQLNIAVEIPLPRVYNFNARNMRKMYPDFNSSMIYPWVVANHRAKIPIYINFESLLDDENQQMLFNIIESKPDLYTINSLVADPITAEIIGLIPSNITMQEFYDLYDANVTNLSDRGRLEVRPAEYEEVKEGVYSEEIYAEVLEDMQIYSEEVAATSAMSINEVPEKDTNLVSGFAALTYVEEMYQRNFGLHKMLDTKARELAPLFKRAEILSTAYGRRDTEEVGRRLLEGDITAIPDFAPFFNSLPLPLDLVHANAYVRFKFRSNSKLVQKALQSKAPKLPFYQKAMEEIKFMLGANGLLVDSVYDFGDFIVKDCGPKGTFKKEMSLWLNRPHRSLCPIDYVSEDERFIIMPKYEPVLLIDPILRTHKINMLRGCISLSNKAQVWKVKSPANWGILDGEYVIVNYPSNRY